MYNGNSKYLFYYINVHKLIINNVDTEMVKIRIEFKFANLTIFYRYSNIFSLSVKSKVLKNPKRFDIFVLRLLSKN